jgi:hypothetical protein
VDIVTVESVGGIDPAIVGPMAIGDVVARRILA